MSENHSYHIDNKDNILNSENFLNNIIFVLLSVDPNSGHEASLSNKTEVISHIVEIFKGIFDGRFSIGLEAERNISMSSKKQTYTERGHELLKRNLMSETINIQKNWKSRNQLYGIACLIEQLFDSNILNPEIEQLRKKLNIDPTDVSLSERRTTAGLVKTEIEAIVRSNRRIDGITYTNIGNNPVVKTNEAGFLSASKTRVISIKIEGVYSIYRRVFIEKKYEVFIREILEIRLSDIGLICSVHSGMTTDESDKAVFNGVALFLEDQIWLMVHSPDVFTKMRVGLAESNIWLKYLEDEATRNPKSGFPMLWQAMGTWNGNNKAISTGSVVRKEVGEELANLKMCSTFLSLNELQEQLTTKEYEIVTSRVDI